MQYEKTNIWITKATAKHGDRFDYSESVYVKARNKITIRCIKHNHTFDIVANDHLQGGGGCTICRTDAVSKSKKLSTKEWITKAKTKHGDRFDYSESVYTGSNSLIDIMCPKHGKFTVRARKHLEGIGGCRNCLKEPKITTDEWIAKAEEVHGDRYDYSNSVFLGTGKPITIVCADHGKFTINAGKHIYGQVGCKGCKCAHLSKVKTSNTEQWIKKATVVHGDKYDYSESVYTSAKSKILNKCVIHGLFEQEAESHLQGAGCPQCTAGHWVSKGCVEWLDSMHIPEQYREVSGLLGKYIVDGYDPLTNTVYEYHGDYWHGNPDLYESDDINPSVGISYGELYRRTYDKREEFRKNGFLVIEMWENDWKTNRGEHSFPPIL